MWTANDPVGKSRMARNLFRVVVSMFNINRRDTEIKISSVDNYCKSSTECLVIGSCLHIVTTFHNNLSETKIANESIMSVQSLIILHLNYSTKSCLISWPARLVKPWMLQTFHVRFPVLVKNAKSILLSSMLKANSKECISSSMTSLARESYTKTAYGCHSTSSL